MNAPDSAPERIPDLEVEVAGRSIQLLPERAAFWVEEATLLVADTHFGKAATFRRAGLAVPAGTTAAALARLDSAVLRTGARRILFLGDLLHSRQGRAPGTLEAIAAWRRYRPGLRLVLVRGNHDRGAGDPPEEFRIECVDPPLREGPFAFAHHPAPVPAAFCFAGHLHPAVRLVGPGRQRERLPCFWFGPTGAVLPAFGDFTGATDIELGRADRVWVIAGGEVFEMA
jgi:uncharacterized protein